jgi:hypothetical protein
MSSSYNIENFLISKTASWKIIKSPLKKLMREFINRTAAKALFTQSL